MPLRAEAIALMTGALRRLEASIDPPQLVRVGDASVFRYARKDIHEAIVQKVARSISTLNAIAVLLRAGFVQEVGVLFRTLDEIHEDIVFLATALTNNARTERHDKYLEVFFADYVFARQRGTLEIAKPNMLPRKKIRAHTIRVLGKGIDVAQAVTSLEAIGTAYSGYVHANSESIMDLYGGDPPQFHVHGMCGTPRIETFARDAGNYIYRGLMATITAAKAFGKAELVEDMYKFLANYEVANGLPSPQSSS